MATVVDLLRKLGKRASGEPNALAGPIVLAGAPPGAAAADAANLAQTGARSSLALLGHGAQVQAFLAATVVSRLRAQPGATALWIVPEGTEGFASTAAIRSAALEAGIEVLEAGGAARIGPAQLVLATPGQLHRHLLYAHDRAWRWLWPRIEHLALPELHLYAGAPAAHLRWLLRRVARLREEARATDSPVLAASMAPVANADATLALFSDHGKLVQGRVRLMRLDDRPPHATLVALWRCGPDRAAELQRLVAELAAHKLSAEVLGDAAPTVVRGPDAPYAHVAVAPRVPRSAAERNTLLRCGYRLLVMLAGDEPHELFFAEHPDRLAGDEVVFPDGSENPYIAAPQLCCAAAELPLIDGELDSWGSVELRDRLAKRGALLSLPGEHAWYARSDPPDPYEELDPRAIGGEPYSIVWPDGSARGIVPPLLIERAGRVGTVVAPGVRVTAVDDDKRSVATAADATAVATLIACSSEVVIRDELAARPIKQLGVELTRGRVTISQRALGLRDLLVDGTQHRVSIQPPHDMQWSAAACWIKLPLAEGDRLADPATAGWSLAYAAPLLMLTTPGALTAAYDEERRTLYIVESEPGGTGVAAALYERFEQLVECAKSLISACSRRPAWERLAASEAEMFAVLGGARDAGAPSPGRARVYSPGRSEGIVTAGGQTNAPAKTEPPHAGDAGQTQPRILRFPTRAQPEAQAGDRAAAIAQSRRPAVYEAPRAVAELTGQLEGPPSRAGSAAGASTLPEAPEAPAAPAQPAGEAEPTQGVFEEIADQPAEAAPNDQAAAAEPPAELARDGAPSPQRPRERQPVEAAAPAEGPTARPDRPEAKEPAAGEQLKPDVQALIERMRRLREEREAQQRDALALQAELGARLLPPVEPDDGEPRFHIGQRVQCLPYGTGIVRSSRRSDERELVLIDFPDYGEIEVDSAVSLLRPVEDEAPPADE